MYRVKILACGGLGKYTSRFHKKDGIDFFETFNPVVRFITIRVILTLVLSHDWIIRQLDVNNAFFNGDLEDVYMKQTNFHSHIPLCYLLYISSLTIVVLPYT